jgi:hypothetical protein
MNPILIRTLAPAALAACLLVSARSEAAQVSNSGPRVGLMMLAGDAANRARELDMSPLMTAFGWQMETEFLSGLGDLRGNSSLVLLAVGADQGRILPSATWLVGLRAADGREVGLGPNLSAAGSGFTLVLGRTRRVGELNIPFNLSATFSPDSFRLGLMTGFNTRDSSYPSARRPMGPSRP